MTSSRFAATVHGMDAAQNEITAPALLPRAHRPLSEIAADMEALRAERAAAIEEMNLHRTENRGRAYTIADVLERLRHFSRDFPDATLWFESTRTEGSPGILAPKPVTSAHSWRGRYNEPAIGGGWTGDTPWELPQAIVEIEKLTIDVFHGYKGGDYEYDDTDTLYLDDYGDYSGENVIVGVITFETPAGDPGVLLVALNTDSA